MPEFMLNRSAYVNGEPDMRGNVHPFYDLNKFAKGYVEAMFFTNGDTGDEREDLLNEWGVEKLTKESVAKIAEKCARFERENAALLAEAYQRDDYDEAQAGRDLWLTSQGHGVGYWDRKQLEALAPEWQQRPRIGERSPAQETELARLREESLGQQLTRAAEAFGESYVEAYRGWIYYR